MAHIVHEIDAFKCCCGQNLLCQISECLQSFIGRKTAIICHANCLRKCWEEQSFSNNYCSEKRENFADLPAAYSKNLQNRDYFLRDLTLMSLRNGSLT